MNDNNFSILDAGDKLGEALSQAQSAAASGVHALEVLKTSLANATANHASFARDTVTDVETLIASFPQAQAAVSILSARVSHQVAANATLQAAVNSAARAASKYFESLASQAHVAQKASDLTTITAFVKAELLPLGSTITADILKLSDAAHTANSFVQSLTVKDWSPASHDIANLPSTWASFKAYVGKLGVTLTQPV